MLVNNPNYGLKMSDLLDLYKNDFKYEDLYDVVKTWLSTEKQYFVNSDLWDSFIDAFCDRFYSRDMNFYTTLDFKINFRNCLKKHKNQAERVYKAGLIEINPLSTYENVVKHTEKTTSKQNTSTDISNNTQSSSNDTTNTTNSSTTNFGNESKNYELHSDTPSNAVNIDDLFSVAKNYVTDAKNHKDESSGTQLVTDNGKMTGSSLNTSEQTGNTTSSHNFENNRDFEEISKGWNGNPVDLLNKYMSLVTDVVQFYLDRIEDDCLFSAVFY